MSNNVLYCTVFFVSISQVIGCEDRLRNELYCVEWGVKLYSNQPTSNNNLKALFDRDRVDCVYRVQTALNADEW